MLRNYTLGACRTSPTWSIPRSHSTNALPDLEGESPAPLGEEAGPPFAIGRLFLLFEGKRKLEHFVFDGDAQHQVLRIFATLEPDCAGNLATGFDGCGLEREGPDLPRCVAESLFALLLHGIFFSTLLLNDVVRSGNRRRVRRFVADVRRGD